MNNSYESEVRERFEGTDAYREYTEKTKDYTKEKWKSAAEGMEAVFAQFGESRTSGAEADSVGVQALVRVLQTYITENYYPCTDEILAGLGQMYIADDRFKKSIDRHGEGTAVFVSAAIDAYCKDLKRK